MQGKDITNSTLSQLFLPISDKRILEKLNSLGVDKYVKKLTTLKSMKLMVYAQLEQHQGLRDISNALNDDEFSENIGIDSISASQISRKLRTTDPKITQEILKSTIQQTCKQMNLNNPVQNIGCIYLIDSSTISLCLSQYRWADFRKTKAGVKLHLRLKFFEEGVTPDKAIITPARPSDKTQMDTLVVEDKDALNVFDRGYIDYKKFDDYCENGSRFITRLKGNAQIKVDEEITVDPCGIIKREQYVYLGKENFNQMKNRLRLIEVQDTQEESIIIITNDFKITAEEIADIYRNRWQIELFFKWIKQNLRIKHFYGLSPWSVENQILIALMSYCLLLLLKLKTCYKGSLLTIKRLLHTCLLEPFTSFVKKLYRPTKKSKGRRRKVDHETIFQQTLRQVMQGEADFLDDLSYDPII
jgi:hypothetical protein